VEQRNPMLLFAAVRFFRIVLLRAQGAAAPDKNSSFFLGQLPRQGQSLSSPAPVGTDASIKISILD
jgi:hypothetical protein